MKLVEQCAGVGAVRWQGQRFTGVPYDIRRFQGLAGSGLPIPGLHRIEGTVASATVTAAGLAVGDSLTLELEDGRTVALTLTDDDGRVLAEGHGPRGGCSCC